MLAADLTFINSYLGFIPAAIDKLQTRGLSLNAQIEIVEDVRTRLRSIPGSRGNSLQVKADEVFTKNRGYMTLRQLNDALISGTSDTPTSLPTSPVILSSYTYAPLTSVDVERSFSDYKQLLTDHRTSFGQQNIEKHLVVMYNQKFL